MAATRIAKTPTTAARYPPTLMPEECAQRAAKVAVDMCVMNTQMFITLSQFMSDGELFHLQMHLLYGLIDTMQVTANVDPQTVLDIARKYFESLKRERKEYASAGVDADDNGLRAR